MNLINTMITSIITRKRELGMLQAIGMSNKQLVIVTYLISNKFNKQSLVDRVRYSE